MPRKVNQHFNKEQRSKKWKKAWVEARKKFPNDLKLQRAFVVDNWDKY